MVLFELRINGTLKCRVGKDDLRSLTGLISGSGKFGDLTMPPYTHNGENNFYVEMFGATGKGPGLNNDILSWFRSDVKVNDVIEIRICEEFPGAPDSGSIVSTLADD